MESLDNFIAQMLGYGNRGNELPPGQEDAAHPATHSALTGSILFLVESFNSTARPTENQGMGYLFYVDNIPFVALTFISARPAASKPLLLNELRACINKIPCMRYAEGMRQKDCSICMDCLVPKKYVRKLTCGHVFHKNCIDKCLMSRLFHCPNCRKRIMAFRRGKVRLEPA